MHCIQMYDRVVSLRERYETADRPELPRIIWTNLEAVKNQQCKLCGVMAADGHQY